MQINDDIVLFIFKPFDYLIYRFFDRNQLVDIWIVVQYRLKCFFSNEMNLRIFQLFFEAAHNGRCQYHIANRTKPNNQNFHGVKGIKKKMSEEENRFFTTKS